MPPLLHDIGKFTESFLRAATGGGGDLGNIHSREFLDKAGGSCISELIDLLKYDWPKPNYWPNASVTNVAVPKTLGDLLYWHHAQKRDVPDLKKYFKAKNGICFPTSFYLMLYADTLDSASSKGGASFVGRGGRESRLNSSKFKQTSDHCFLITPFGEEECKLEIKAVPDASKNAQKELAKIIKRLFNNTVNLFQLQEIRTQIISLLKTPFSNTLAETRMPQNDVSLWQHCCGVASLFKAMLARHVLLNQWNACDDRGELTYYIEKLAILGVCWSEDELISDSYRPTEILGRRYLLDDCVQTLKEKMEVDCCLGNEIYRDRDGIYFLVPSPDEDKRIAKAITEFEGSINDTFNSEDAFGGELNWKTRCKEIGRQILGLTDVINKTGDDVRERACGPRSPLWVNTWQGLKSAHEICPRCGLRPVDLTPVAGGSEADKGKMCSHCRKLAKRAENIRSMRIVDEALQDKLRRLQGIDHSARYCTYDIDKLKGPTEGEDEEGNRLALIQGIVDLRPFFSGQAFSSILAAQPGDFTKQPGDKDHSREIDTWDKMIDAANQSWKAITNGLLKEDGEAHHTLQQIFHDSWLGTKADGRVKGKDAQEKAKNLLEQIVLASPFDKQIAEDEAAKMVNYAMRQHPAPSRLARMWETTAAFTKEPVWWCEFQKVSYSPLSLDPGRFMILVPANEAWRLICHINDEYVKRFGRVRHLLPLHLSATVFYHKSPLYIAIDAARRFSRLGLGRSAEWWKLKERKIEDDKYILYWEAPEGKEVRWRVPRMLPNGREDRFFTWFWPKSGRHPVHVSEIENGVIYRVYPSTFDYEILDATVRRYDIRFLPEKTCRPHSFVRHGGPRPYRLSDLEVWQGLDSVVEGVEKHQQKILIELLARLHRDWHDSQYTDERGTVSRDAVRIFLRPEKNEDFDALARMAEDGSIFDLFEWRDLIRNVQSQPTQ